MLLSHLNEAQCLSSATVKRASKRATLLEHGLKNYMLRVLTPTFKPFLEQMSLL